MTEYTEYTGIEFSEETLASMNAVPAPQKSAREILAPMREQYEREAIIRPVVMVWRIVMTIAVAFLIFRAL